MTFFSSKTPTRFKNGVDTRLRRVSTRETARISQGRAGWKMLGCEHGHHGRSRARLSSDLYTSTAWVGGMRVKNGLSKEGSGRRVVWRGRADRALTGQERWSVRYGSGGS